MYRHDQPHKHTATTNEPGKIDRWTIQFTARNVRRRKVQVSASPLSTAHLHLYYYRIVPTPLACGQSVSHVSKKPRHADSFGLFTATYFVVRSFPIYWILFWFSEFDAMNKSSFNPLNGSNALRKHVKFPDNFNGVVQEILCGDESNGNASDTVAIETPPSVVVVSFWSKGNPLDSVWSVNARPRHHLPSSPPSHFTCAKIDYHIEMGPAQMTLFFIFLFQFWILNKTERQTIV